MMLTCSLEPHGFDRGRFFRISQDLREEDVAERWKETLVILGREPWNGICQYCDRYAIIRARTRNTKYIDPNRNIQVSCFSCYARDFLHYKSLLEDYYASVSVVGVWL